MSSLTLNKTDNQVQIFETVQGEGAFLGVPSFFIRLQGCSVRCFFCDEKKTWALGTKNEQILNYEEILEQLQIMNSGLKRVVITGGEPTEQDIVPFIKFLNSHGYKVALESAMTGEYAEAVLDYIFVQEQSHRGTALERVSSRLRRTNDQSLWLTFSPKAIYSEAGEPSDERVYALAHELKFVIADDKSLDFLENTLLPKILFKDTVKEAAVENEVAQRSSKLLFLVPDWNNIQENQVRILKLLKKYPEILRIGIQAHKYWNIA
ncbi:MAG: 7-carboxy-7-deazaguanine synthase QueE [Candidatus Melainabacteria bacterium]|nr:7-carboxy-7-deazaguanine synthase QueE [Candidatus Melainabacteria bacterium]